MVLVRLSQGNLLVGMLLPFCVLNTRNHRRTGIQRFRGSKSRSFIEKRAEFCVRWYVKSAKGLFIMISLEELSLEKVTYVHDNLRLRSSIRE